LLEICHFYRSAIYFTCFDEFIVGLILKAGAGGTIMKARFWLAQKEEMFDQGSDPLTRPAPLGIVALVLGTLIFWTGVVIAVRNIGF
jgi:hypothetical protein